MSPLSAGGPCGLARLCPGLLRYWPLTRIRSARSGPGKALLGRQGLARGPWPGFSPSDLTQVPGPPFRSRPAPSRSSPAPSRSSPLRSGLAGPCSTSPASLKVPTGLASCRPTLLVTAPASPGVPADHAAWGFEQRVVDLVSTGRATRTLDRPNPDRLACPDRPACPDRLACPRGPEVARSAAAGAAATPSAATTGRWSCHRAGSTAAARHGDRGEQLHGVVVTLRAGRGLTRLPHRAADLERVAA